MIKVVTVEQMRDIERATDAAGTTYDEMMQHAGRAVADVVRSLLGEDIPSKRVVVLVGPGNNGGDGLVAARILKEEAGAQVSCYLSKARNDTDPVFTAARDAGVFIAAASDDQRWRVLKSLLGSANVIVDALLGTGARLPIEGDLRKLLQQVAAGLIRPGDGKPAPLVWPALPERLAPARPMVVAVDCPSGLDCDTGLLDPASIAADVTVTFAAAKVGQVSFPGAEAVGALVVADINTPPDLPELATIRWELATAAGVGRLLPPRPISGHKGTFGRVVVLAGSVNYTGAASLAGASAYRAGAGLVTMAVPQAIYAIVASQVPEATWLLLPHDMGVISAPALEVFHQEVGDYEALLIGPGLGREEATLEFMRGLLQGQQLAKRGSIGFGGRASLQEPEAGARRLPPALVIDADGLNLLSQIEGWPQALPANTVLTPHPGEMARLSGLSRDEVVAARFAVAQDKAAEWKAVVVLKGAFTLVAAPDRRLTILPFATDALATGGTGDVLAGCIAGLMAQGVGGYEAAIIAAYMHGLAGQLAAAAATSRSVVAGDVLRALPEALALLERGR